MGEAIYGALGAAVGVLVALRLVFRLNPGRPLKAHSRLRTARDVMLLVAGSFAGMLAMGGLLPWRG